MGKVNNTQDGAARTPTIRIPWMRIPQPDGSILLRPGKPIVQPEEVGCPEFARLVGLSERRIQYLCEVGAIECRRATTAPHSKYLIPLAEVDRYLNLRD